MGSCLSNGKNTWLLRILTGLYYYQLCGDYFINHYKDLWIPIKQPVKWKLRGSFEAPQIFQIGLLSSKIVDDRFAYSSAISIMADRSATWPSAMLALHNSLQCSIEGSLITFNAPGFDIQKNLLMFLWCFFISMMIFPRFMYILYSSSSYYYYLYYYIWHVNIGGRFLDVSIEYRVHHLQAAINACSKSELWRLAMAVRASSLCGASWKVEICIR